MDFQNLRATKQHQGKYSQLVSVIKEGDIELSVCSFYENLPAGWLTKVDEPLRAID